MQPINYLFICIFWHLSFLFPSSFLMRSTFKELFEATALSTIHGKILAWDIWMIIQEEWQRMASSTMGDMACLWARIKWVHSMLCLEDFHLLVSANWILMLQGVRDLTFPKEMVTGFPAYQVHWKLASPLRSFLFIERGTINPTIPGSFKFHHTISLKLAMLLELTSHLIGGPLLIRGMREEGNQQQ